MRTLRSSWGACRPRAEREEQTGHRLTLLRSVRTVVLYVVKSVVRAVEPVQSGARAEGEQYENVFIF